MNENRMGKEHLTRYGTFTNTTGKGKQRLFLWTRVNE